MLEGALDLVTLLGTPLPAQVHLAVGHYGTGDGDPLAAYRYTEARLTALAESMMRDIDLDMPFTSQR